MNLINLLFIQLTLTVGVLGALINLIEKYLPIKIQQMFRYVRSQKNNIINHV